MWDRNVIYQEYRIIRRRVERHLGGGQLLLAHLGAFLIGTLYVLSQFTPSNFTVHPVVTSLGVLGAAALVGHGLLTLRQSGANARKRDQAIDSELKERTRQDDTELLADPRLNFRLRGMLDEDVHQRAGYLVSVVMALVFNLFAWGVWMVIDMGGSSPWRSTVPLMLFILLPLLALHGVRRWQREDRIKRILGDWRVTAASIPLAAQWDEQAYAARLSDDGELVDFYMDDEQQKAKRS